MNKKIKCYACIAAAAFVTMVAVAFPSPLVVFAATTIAAGAASAALVLMGMDYHRVPKPRCYTRCQSVAGMF